MHNLVAMAGLRKRKDQTFSSGTLRVVEKTATRSFDP